MFDFISRKTPSHGSDLNIISQLLGNFGKKTTSEAGARSSNFVVNGGSCDPARRLPCVVVPDRHRAYRQGCNKLRDTDRRRTTQLSSPDHVTSDPLCACGACVPLTTPPTRPEGAQRNRRRRLFRYRLALRHARPMLVFLIWNSQLPASAVNGRKDLLTKVNRAASPCGGSRSIERIT